MRLNELEKLRGVGPKRLEQLREMGIEEVQDLLRRYPRRYLNFNETDVPEEAEDGGMYVFRCTLAGAPVPVKSRRGMPYVRAELVCGGSRLTAVWFNNRFVADALKEDEEYLFFGKVKVEDGVTLMNPKYRSAADAKAFDRLQPVYTLPPEFPESAYCGIVAEALKLGRGRTVIPGEIAEAEGLADVDDAYARIHRPKSYADVGAASSRLALEEILQLMLALRFAREDAAAVRVNAYPDTDYGPYRGALPFRLTDGQEGALARIAEGLSGRYSLNLLVQGDVGSGKTAVAFAAMYLAAKNGYQAALLAPTEVLADQHAKKAAELFGRLGISTALLKGSMPQAEKRRVYGELASGKAQVLIGTHAIFQRDVAYRRLALVVTDEQHRFGVRQRAALAEKGAQPDVIVMSATPIPRTLSLVLYGDLDVVAIPAKPAGRLPVKTSIVPKRKYADLLGYLARETAAGRQAYVVCPLIEDDAESGKNSVAKVSAELSKRLSGIAVGALHGGMAQEEKERVMGAFARGETSLLVATTVVEVGVDVPNANIMVILDADRFGLSQLHQLRGRVGRGDAQSYCFLLTETQNAASLERLRLLCATTDGFEIAEKDFEARGGGELLGERQSGFDCSVLRRVKLDGRVVERAGRIQKLLPKSPEYRRFFRENCAKQYREIEEITI